MNLAHIFIKNELSAERYPLCSDLRYMFVEQQMPYMTWAQNWEHGLQLSGKLLNEQQEAFVCIHGPNHFVLDLNNFTRKAIEAFSNLDVQVLWDSSRGLIARASFIKKNETEIFQQLKSGLAGPWSADLIAESVLLNEGELDQVEGHLKKMGSLAADDIASFSSFEEKKLFQVLLQDREAGEKTIFLVNNEGFSKDQANLSSRMKIHTLCVLASGLKPIVLFDLVNNEQLKNIIFFDISGPALQFYQHMVENWDGEDYLDFLNQALCSKLPFSESLKNSPDIVSGVFDHEAQSLRPDERVQEKFLQMQNAVGGKASFLQIWKKIKEKNLSFVKVDLIHDFASMGIHRFEGPALIWFSNIYDYRPTFFMNQGRKGIFKKQRMFFDHCAEAQRPIYLSGFCPERDSYIVGQPWVG